MNKEEIDELKKLIKEHMDRDFRKRALHLLRNAETAWETGYVIGIEKSAEVVEEFFTNKDYCRDILAKVEQLKYEDDNE